MDKLLPQSEVPVDQFRVVTDDQLLVTRLAGSFALCLGDELHDAGALLHMQAGRPGRVNDPELTDNTLSTDLLLIDRCLADLRAAEPRARHLQARFVAHADPAAGGHERLAGIRSFVEALLEDAGIRLVSSASHDGPPLRVSFRPSLGQLRCDPG